MTTKVLNERHFLRVVVENNPKGPFMYVTKFPTSQKFQSGYPFGSLDPGVTRDPVFFPHQRVEWVPKMWQNEPARRGRTSYDSSFLVKVGPFAALPPNQHFKSCPISLNLR